MITLAKYQSNVNANIQGLNQTLDRDEAEIQSITRQSENSAQVLGTVYDEIATWGRWVELAGSRVRVVTRTGFLLVTVSAATYAANTRVAVGYRLTDDNGTVAERSMNAAFLSDKRSPHSEFDRVNNGSYCQVHTLPVGPYTGTVHIYSDIIDPPFGTEEALVQNVLLTMKEL